MPIIPYDYRDTTEALVHKDLRLAFDGNRYCVHQRYVGRRLIIKADSGSVTIYDRVEEVVSYPRSWRRGQTFGADRFEKILAEDRPAFVGFLAFSMLMLAMAWGLWRARYWAVLGLEALLGILMVIFSLFLLRFQNATDLVICAVVLIPSGPEDVARAIEKAAAARAFGADYIANILRQHRSPRRPQPPLRLRDPLLNELATDPISLLEYDAFILESGKECDDSPRTETAATQSESDEPSGGGNDR